MYASVGGGNLETAAPYILDIDLDYFHSDKSVRPDTPSTFYRLIRGAVGITIAKEPWFVMDGRIEGEDITSKSLLDAIMSHIDVALRQ